MKTVKLLRNKNFKIVRGDTGGEVEEGIVSLARCLDFLFGMGTVDAFFVPICKELHLDHNRFMQAFWNHVLWKSK